MSSLAVAGVVFVSALAGALVSMLAARRLPGHHLSNDSREVVKLGLGVIATLTALVLGLLVASAKAAFDAQDGAVKQLATQASVLDRFLARYGPETKGVREQLREIVVRFKGHLWPDGGSGEVDLTPETTRALADSLYGKIGELQPTSDVQRTLKARILDLASDLGQARYRLYVQNENPIPTPFLVVLGLWLVTLFAGYGLLAPPNATVVVVLTVCAFSISAALFLILELGKPFEGVIRVSPVPVAQALSQIGK